MLVGISPLVLIKSDAPQSVSKSCCRCCVSAVDPTRAFHLSLCLCGSLWPPLAFIRLVLRPTLEISGGGGEAPFIRDIISCQARAAHVGTCEIRLK